RCWPPRICPREYSSWRSAWIAGIEQQQPGRINPVSKTNVRAREVRPGHSSSEADEQRQTTGSGAGGAKGRGRGEREPAKHAPGAGPGKRGPGAGTRTTSRKAKEEERFTALFHHLSIPMLRTAFFALKRDAAPEVDWVRWQDYETDLDRRIED